MDLSQLQKVETKLNRINKAKIEGLLEDEILANKEKIVDIVRERWRRGLRPNGDIIGTYRSFFYQQEKQQKNPLAKGNVDLIYEGDLNRELTVFHSTGSLFTIFSTDEKALLIAQKYGLDVYGLTEEEQIMVIGEGLMRVNNKLLKELNA